MNVYIAAPLFSEGERLTNLSICAAIEPQCAVYLPQRDGPLVESVVATGTPDSQAGRLAYQSDIDALNWCDTLVAVLDGRALDEGVCIEMGFAKALGKRIIGFKTDVRCVLPWGNNPMVEGCVDEWVKNTTELAIYVTKVQQGGGRVGTHWGFTHLESHLEEN